MNRLRFIRVWLMLVVAVCLFAYSLTNAQDRNDTAKVLVREVIQSSVNRSTEMTSFDHKITDVAVLPTIAEDERVHSLGDSAVDALGEYVTNENSQQQLAAIRLLASFRSDNALKALVQFAEHSHHRTLALGILCSFPAEKTRAIYDKFASSDPDPEIRQSAKHCFELDGDASRAEDRDKDKSQLVVQEVIQAAIYRSMRKASDGSRIIVSPLLATNEEQEAVRQLGNHAVPKAASIRGSPDKIEKLEIDGTQPISRAALHAG